MLRRAKEKAKAKIKTEKLPSGPSVDNPLCEHTPIGRAEMVCVQELCDMFISHCGATATPVRW